MDYIRRISFGSGIIERKSLACSIGNDMSNWLHILLEYDIKSGSSGDRIKSQN